MPSVVAGKGSLSAAASTATSRCSASIQSRSSLRPKGVYYERAISLPMYAGLTEMDQDYVIEKLKEFLK